MAQGSGASLTASAVDELAAISVTRPAVRAAGLATMLRCAGELHRVPGRDVITAEVARASVADRIRADISLLYGYTTAIAEHQRDSPAAAGRYTVRVVDNTATLVRQLGLIDHRGHPVQGLPARIVGGPIAQTEAALRGAFCVSGNIADARRASVTVACPTWEVAVALAGAARRLDILAKARDGHRGDHITIRGGDTISALLHRLGAPNTAARYTDQRAHARHPRAGTRLTNFDNANEHRTHISAAVTVARVTRAFDILGDTAPTHLAEFGRLRLAHPQATLDELGRLADPPVTKDTASGRLRRLLATADTRAALHHIPDTNAAVPDELREQL